MYSEEPFMRKRSIACLLLGSVFCVIGGTLQAAVISEFTGGTASASPQFAGQSLTTAAGGPWNSLTFNFFSDTAGGTTPSAAGTLFLLSSAYSGTPAALNAATPGFIAQSQSIAGNIYQFNPSVTILGSTQYFFYSNAQLLVSGANSDAFAGGTAFLSSGSYAPFDGDANFRLSGAVGAAVPEPGTLALLGSAVLAMFAARRRR